MSDSPRAAMLSLSERLVSPLPEPLPAGVKEALYAVALASTLSAGRREIAQVGDVILSHATTYTSTHTHTHTHAHTYIYTLCVCVYTYK